MCYLDEPEDRDIPTMDDNFDRMDAAWFHSDLDRALHCM